MGFIHFHRTASFSLHLQFHRINSLGLSAYSSSPLSLCSSSNKIKCFGVFSKGVRGFTSGSNDSNENRPLHANEHYLTFQELHKPRMMDCILVRHGESEGNIAYNRSWEGDHSLYTDAFLRRHSSFWRLTDRGREQAQAAGEWIKNNVPLNGAVFINGVQQLQDDNNNNKTHTNIITPNSHHSYFRHYTSEYIRAIETAALMKLPNAQWTVEVQLRERDWGSFDILSQRDRVARFSEETRRHDRDSLFYAPPGGESLVSVLTRVDGVLLDLHRSCTNAGSIVVCHGEVMWSFRLRFERLSQLTYREMEATPTTMDRIHNAQIIWYSRRNPFTGEVTPYFKWKRSVCPWDLSLSPNEWVPINKVEHTNESLLKHANRIKRIYAHHESYREQLKKAENPSSSSSKPAPLKKHLQNLPSLAVPLKVLILTKTPRFQIEKKKLNLEGEELKQALLRLGFISERLMASSRKHEENLSQLILALQQHGMLVTCKNAYDAVPSDIEGFNLIMSAGGDGTFLRAASIITPFAKLQELQKEKAKKSKELSPPDAFLSSAIFPPSSIPNPVPVPELANSETESPNLSYTLPPLIGVNTDSQHSEGHLCSFSILGPHTAERVIDHIRKGHFVWQERSRIVVSITNPHTNEVTVIPQLAINDILIAERDAWKPFVYELSIEKEIGGHTLNLKNSNPTKTGLVNRKANANPNQTKRFGEIEVQRSSGIIVSTGTGSTGWIMNAAGADGGLVSRVLSEAGHGFTNAESREISERVSNHSVFEITSSEIEFKVREPILNQTTSLAGRSYKNIHGWAASLQIRSLGWDAIISIDGITAIPLPTGYFVTLSTVHPSYQTSLFTLSIAGTGGKPFSKQ